MERPVSSDGYTFKDGYLVRREPYMVPARWLKLAAPTRPCPQCGTALNRQPGNLQHRGFHSCPNCEHCEETK